MSFPWTTPATSRETLYLSMRLIEGRDLRMVVDAEGPLDLRRVARIVAGVAAGLDAAQAHGMAAPLREAGQRAGGGK